MRKCANDYTRSVTLDEGGLSNLTGELICTHIYIWAERIRHVLRNIRVYDSIISLTDRYTYR